MRKWLDISAAALVLVVVGASAACTNAPGTQPSATPTATPAPACPVGIWKSTGATAKGTASTLSFNLDGGADAGLTVGTDGAVKSNFEAMTPIVFTVETGGVQVAGEYFYRGSASGTVALTGTSTSSTSSTSTSSAATSTTTPTTTGTSGGSTATTGAGASGPWRPTGTVTTTDLRVTVKLTKPVSATVIDNVKVGDVTGAQAAQVGNVIDIQPTFHNGTYRCDGNDKLTITPAGSTGPLATWAFVRV